MVLVRIPNTLRSLTGGVGELTVDGADLAAVLVSLETRHPGFEERLMTDDGFNVGVLYRGDREPYALTQDNSCSTPYDFTRQFEV